MNKQFKLQNLPVGSTIAWQIVTLSSKELTIGLKSSKRFFFGNSIRKHHADPECAGRIYM